MDEVKVSIVVPVYNAEKYLARCLDSIIRQTLTEIEIFCIDDGSTDASWEIIQGFAARDVRITAIRQANGGVAVARNRGLEQAAGEYVGFVDSDDYVDHDYFEELYRTAKQHDSDISRAYLRAESDGDSAYAKDVLGNPEAYEDMYNKQARAAVEKNKFVLKNVVWLSVYRRTVLRDHAIAFHPELRTGQDNLFNLEASYFANKVVYAERPAYYHRVARDGSLMSDFNFTDDGLLVRSLVFARIVERLNAKPDYSEDVYAERVLDSLNFLRTRLHHVTRPGTARELAKRLSTAWGDVLYKDDVLTSLVSGDPDFAESLGSRRALTRHIQRVSGTSSVGAQGSARRLLKAVLPRQAVALYRRAKAARPGANSPE